LRTESKFKTNEFNYISNKYHENSEERKKISSLICTVPKYTPHLWMTEWGRKIAKITLMLLLVGLFIVVM
jgi:hypothetical protein